MKEELLKRIEEYVNDYADANGGNSPSVREIGAALGVSRGTVSNYLIYMRQEGMIRYEGVRCIVTSQKRKAAGTNVDVPLLGTVACGIPIFAEENIEEYVSLPVSLVGRGEVYILHAKGDSMINAGIRDGDYVLVRRQETAEYNQLVVALIGDEATLKRYRPQPDCVVLHPENPAYDDIRVNAEDCAIQGIVFGVYSML